MNAFSQSHASDQDWEDIQFEHKDPGNRQVGLEHLFSKEFYANKPMFNTKVNLTWSKLPRTLTNRYVRHGHIPSRVHQDLLFNNATAQQDLLFINGHRKAADNITKSSAEAQVPTLDTFTMTK